jgi:hypothetical protein
MRPSSLLLPAALITVACGATNPKPAPPPLVDQTYAQGLQLLCEVDSRAAISAEADPLTIEQLRQDFWERELHSPDGIYLRTILRVKEPSQAAALLRREAQAQGICSCPLADTWQAG